MKGTHPPHISRRRTPHPQALWEYKIRTVSKRAHSTNFLWCSRAPGACLGPALDERYFLSVSPKLSAPLALQVHKLGSEGIVVPRHQKGEYFKGVCPAEARCVAPNILVPMLLNLMTTVNASQGRSRQVLARSACEAHRDLEILRSTNLLFAGILSSGLRDKCGGRHGNLRSVH